MSKISSKEEHKDNVLERARAEILNRIRNPKTETERVRFSKWEEEQPFALSVANKMFDTLDQYLNAEFFIPQDENKNPLPFNPKIHWKVDTNHKCIWGRALLDKLADSRASFKGPLTDRILECVEKIGKPVQDMLGGLMGKSDELDTPEEVPELV